MNEKTKESKKTKEMTFWEHIYELRRRIFIIVISVFILSIISYFLFPYIVDAIQETINEKLHVFQIPEGFLIRIQLSFITGLFLSIPFILFQILLFIFPALTIKEKAFFLSILIGSFVLFVSGIIFSYKMVLPISINFLKRGYFIPKNAEQTYSYKEYIQFFFKFLIGFGVCFQFPIVLLLLLKFKLIKLSFLIKNFKYVIVICFILSAILTPPDVVSQLLLAIPMIILYGLCIIIGLIFRLGKE